MSIAKTLAGIDAVVHKLTEAGARRSQKSEELKALLEEMVKEMGKEKGEDLEVPEFLGSSSRKLTTVKKVLEHRIESGLELKKRIEKGDFRITGEFRTLCLRTLAAIELSDQLLDDAIKEAKRELKKHRGK